MNKTKRRTFIAQLGAALSTTIGAGFVRPGASLAEEPDPAMPVSRHGLVERVLLTWADDPAHSQAFTWRHLAECKSPTLQIAPWTAAPKLSDGVRSIDGACELVTLPDGRKVSECKANAADLSANAHYFYRLGDGKAWSEWLTFRTASDKSERFRFLYLGDVQNDIRSMCPRTLRAAFAQAPDARFIVHAGDLIAEGYDDALWDEWCYTMGWVGATVPHLPVPGNHDMHRAPNDPDPGHVRTVSPWWYRRFTLPANGPEGVDALRQEAYSIDYQGVRLISLDANVYANDEFEPEKRADIAAAQTAWLERLLVDNPNRWTIVMHHHPLYSVGKDRDNVALRETLLPLYDKYRVDLVLQGHDHHYGRSHKLAGGKVVAPDQAGTVYAVSVAGPKMYPRNPKFESLMARLQGDTQMYQVVDVDANRLSFAAYAVTGELVDSFELRKSAKDGPSILTTPGLPASEGSLLPR